MRFYDQRIVIFSRVGAQIQWEVEAEATVLSNVEVEIQRSEAELGPFKTLRTVDILDTFSFIDKLVPFRAQNQIIHYRLVARDKSTGDLVQQGNTFSLLGQLPLDALEIIRQHRVLLEGLNGHPPLRGIECTIYKKRNFGPPCRSCTDALTGHVVVSNCKECHGTGKVLGYYNPINAFLNIQPYPVNLQLTNFGKIEPSDSQMFLTNFPVLYSGDVIVEPSEKHWRVVRIDVTERQRTLVHQLASVTQLKPDDIVHETLLHSSHLEAL